MWQAWQSINVGSGSNRSAITKRQGEKNMNEALYIGIGYLGAGIGAGLTVLGAGLGIGRLAGSALEGTARQPEAAGVIRTTMIIAAALIEGLGFFALAICLMVVFNFGKPKVEQSASPAHTQVEVSK